jgi:hypothetical protein
MSKAGKKKSKEPPFKLTVKVEDDEFIVKELQMKKKFLEEQYSNL